MDHAYQAVSLMPMTMASFPCQFGDIRLAPEQGSGLSGGICLIERRDAEASSTWLGSKLLLQAGQRWLLHRAKADLLKAPMPYQSRVKATVSHILAERLIGKTQAEIGGMNRQPHAATI